jgi:hypothetical protein
MNSESQIATITLSNWESLHSHVQPGWIYRGQRQATWSLETSLERTCNREEVELKDRFYIEDELFREFRRTYHQYSIHVPLRTSVLEWISIMQHYGAPSRLLDFTYSIYVAAYFALEHADSDSAVWAVNSVWAQEQSRHLFQHVGKPNPEQLQTRTVEEHELLYRDLLFSLPYVKAIVMCTPFQLNERLSVQRGTFLAPGDVNSTFMDNLLSIPGHE